MRKNAWKEFGITLAFAICLLWAARSGLSAASRAPGGRPPGESGTLLLVRAWDQKSGELTGWLPIHRAAMRLELMDKGAPPMFEMNTAVNVSWLTRQEDDPETLRVSPEVLRVDGRDCLPVLRDSNLVRVAKKLFLIKQLILGDSKWARPTEVQEPEVRSQKPEEEKK